MSQCQELIKQEQVVSVDMRDASAEQVEEVFWELTNNTSLYKLSVESTSLTAESMATLSVSLADNSTPPYLILWHCDLDDYAVEKLSEALDINASVNSLVLASNPRITDTGASHLAAMLTVNNTLQYLDLSNCSISDIGVQHLSRELQGNDSIIELVLSYNEAITDTGAVALSEMLLVNKSLKRLHLLGTSVGEEGAAALQESMQQNDTVTIWVSNNLI